MLYTQYRYDSVFIFPERYILRRKKHSLILAILVFNM